MMMVVLFSSRGQSTISLKYDKEKLSRLLQRCRKKQISQYVIKIYLREVMQQVVESQPPRLEAASAVNGS